MLLAWKDGKVSVERLWGEERMKWLGLIHPALPLATRRP